jgi:hypothetical protein
MNFLQPFTKRTENPRKICQDKQLQGQESNPKIKYGVLTNYNATFGTSDLKHVTRTVLKPHEHLCRIKRLFLSYLHRIYGRCLTNDWFFGYLAKPFQLLMLNSRPVPLKSRRRQKFKEDKQFRHAVVCVVMRVRSGVGWEDNRVVFSIRTIQSNRLTKIWFL